MVYKASTILTFIAVLGAASSLAAPIASTRPVAVADAPIATPSSSSSPAVDTLPTSTRHQGVPRATADVIVKPGASPAAHLKSHKRSELEEYEDLAARGVGNGASSRAQTVTYNANRPKVTGIPPKRTSTAKPKPTTGCGGHCSHTSVKGGASRNGLTLPTPHASATAKAAPVRNSKGKREVNARSEFEEYEDLVARGGVQKGGGTSTFKTPKATSTPKPTTTASGCGGGSCSQTTTSAKGGHAGSKNGAPIATPQAGTKTTAGGPKGTAQPASSQKGSGGGGA